MSFWTQDFMDNRRKQFLNSLVSFQYLVNGNWYDATVNTKRIVGNKVEIIVSFPRTSNGSQTIKAVRIIDVTGKQAGYQETNIYRTAKKGVLTKFEFPIVEKEGES